MKLDFSDEQSMLKKTVRKMVDEKLSVAMEQEQEHYQAKHMGQAYCPVYPKQPAQ